jgi:hypothetical protein
MRTTSEFRSALRSVWLDLETPFISHATRMVHCPVAVGAKGMKQ